MRLVAKQESGRSPHGHKRLTKLTGCAENSKMHVHGHGHVNDTVNGRASVKGHDMYPLKTRRQFN